jgi:EmrB/QacA subfamily drug resistance transporter
VSENSTKKTTLLVTSLANFLFPFNVFAMNIALPTIGKEFSMDAFTLSWVSTGFLLASAIFLIPFGKLSDIKGRKKIFNYGLLIFSIVSIPLAFSNSPFMLILLRAIQGVGGAMYLGTLMAILTGVYPIGERGTAMGINTMAVSIGISSGPFLGGILTQYLGWRSIFLVNVPIGLLIVALVLLKIKMEWKEAEGERFDFKGFLLYAVVFVMVMYGITILPSLTGIGLIAAGCLLLPVFIKLENNIPSPILKLNIFRGNKPFVFSNVAALIYFAATFAVTYMLSLYLQYSKGYGASDAGIIIVVQSIVTIFFSPIAGRLTDKYGARIIASTGMLFTTIGILLLAFIGQGTSLEYLIMSLLLLGLGAAFFNGPNQYAIMSSVDRKLLGVASGMLGTMRQIGQVLSMALATVILTLIVGNTQITPSQYPLFLVSAQLLFGVFVALCLLAMFASLVRGKI